MCFGENEDHMHNRTMGNDALNIVCERTMRYGAARRTIMDTIRKLAVGIAGVGLFVLAVWIGVHAEQAATDNHTPN